MKFFFSLFFGIFLFSNISLNTPTQASELAEYSKRTTERMIKNHNEINEIIRQSEVENSSYNYNDFLQLTKDEKHKKILNKIAYNMIKAEGLKTEKQSILALERYINYSSLKNISGERNEDALILYDKKLLKLIDEFNVTGDDINLFRKNIAQREILQKQHEESKFWGHSRENGKFTFLIFIGAIGIIFFVWFLDKKYWDKQEKSQNKKTKEESEKKEEEETQKREQKAKKEREQREQREKEQREREKKTKQKEEDKNTWDSTDPFIILGVSKYASKKEIKNAFKKLSKKYHPDLHPNEKEKYTKIMQKINEAYNKIK